MHDKLAQTVVVRETGGHLSTVSYRDEHGAELLDLPDQPLPPASTPLPVRLLARWDQPLLAYADRERIVPLELQPLRLTLSGDPTVTVDGRVAASWRLQRDRDAVKLTVTPHVEIRRSARDEIRAEAERTARFCEPDARGIDVAGVQLTGIRRLTPETARGARSHIVPARMRRR